MPDPGPVLLVEDDPSDVLLIGRAFRMTSLPNRLIVLSDGAQAKSYLSGHPPYDNRLEFPFPALILLDLYLPILDGFQFLEWLRNDSELSRVPVVVLTSSVFSPDVKRAYALGANSFLIKPVDPAEMADLLKAAAQFWLQTCQLPEPAEPPLALPQTDPQKLETGSG